MLKKTPPGGLMSRIRLNDRRHVLDVHDDQVLTRVSAVDYY